MYKVTSVKFWVYLLQAIYSVVSVYWRNPGFKERERELLALEEKDGIGPHEIVRTRLTIFFLSGGVQIGPGVFENEPPLSILPFKIGKNRKGRPILYPPYKKICQPCSKSTSNPDDGV